MSNFLVTILQFSLWFVTQVLHRYLLMRTYLKYHNGSTNGKCCLILMLQAQEVVFSRKTNPSNHKNIYFNNMLLNRKDTQKHVGLYLDAKLNFLNI